MMQQGLKQPWVLIVLCIVIHAGVGWKFGVVVFVTVTPLFAALLARPLMDWVAQIRRQLNEHVWRDVRGRYYVFRGTAVGVWEDAHGQRWVCVDDVSKVIPSSAWKSRLTTHQPWSLREMGDPPQVHVRADVLLDGLQPLSARRARRFREWLRREVVYPSTRLVQPDILRRDPG